jgi:cytochrome c oxidase subunit II
VSQGYVPIMPTFQGQISEEGVIALVEYIKHLDSYYRVQQITNTTQLPPGSERTAPSTQTKSAPGKVNQ